MTGQQGTAPSSGRARPGVRCPEGCALAPGTQADPSPSPLPWPRGSLSHPCQGVQVPGPRQSQLGSPGPLDVHPTGLVLPLLLPWVGRDPAPGHEPSSAEPGLSSRKEGGSGRGWARRFISHVALLGKDTREASDKTNSLKTRSRPDGAFFPVFFFLHFFRKPGAAGWGREPGLRAQAALRLLQQGVEVERVELAAGGSRVEVLPVRVWKQTVLP